jgi:hypothetical protein
MKSITVVHVQEMKLFAVPVDELIVLQVDEVGVSIAV